MNRTRGLTWLLAGSLFAAALTVTLAQEAAPKGAGGGTPAAGPAPTTALRVESRMTLWNLIRSGGWAMYPLGACSVAVVWLIAINASRVNQKKMIPPQVIGQLKQAASAGDVQQVWNIAAAADSGGRHDRLAAQG